MIVFKISIDDFYKTRKDRMILAKKVHPLLMTRGVPGTHDVDLILSFLEKFQRKDFHIYYYRNLINQLMTGLKEINGIKLKKT